MNHRQTQSLLADLFKLKRSADGPALLAQLPAAARTFRPQPADLSPPPAAAAEATQQLHHGKKLGSMAADKVAALAEHLEVRTLLTALGAARKLRLPTVVKDFEGLCLHACCKGRESVVLDCLAALHGQKFRLFLSEACLSPAVHAGMHAACVCCNACNSCGRHATIGSHSRHPQVMAMHL